MEHSIPLPKPTPLSAPFWKGTREEKLLLQKCGDCGHFRWTPQLLCDRCLSEAYDWTQVSGRGTLYSYTVVHRAPVSGFAVPYVIAVVELAEGPLMLTSLIDWTREDLVIGRAVEVAFDHRDKISLYPFRPVEAAVTA